MGNRKSAVQFFNAAIKATQDQSYKDWATHAFQLFNSACLVDPTFGKGWYQQGNNNGDLNRLHAAVACYRRALTGDIDTPDRVHCLSNLSWRLHQLGELEEALTSAQASVELDPTHAYGWVNLSVAHGAFGERIAAVQTARKALELKPDDTTVQYNLAFALLFNQQWAEGFKFYEARFPERIKHFGQYPYPKWLGEEGKTVLLVSEQGMGDTLSFCRFIDAAAKRAQFIHAMVQPALLRALTEAFVHLPNVHFVPPGTGFPAADAWTTFGSLPFALGLSNSEIEAAPHPRLPVYGMDTSWKVPDTKLHIGIAWSGAAQNDINHWRNIPLMAFLDLYKVDGIQLYSLQVEDGRQELINFSCESLVRDLSPWISDVTDTVSILQHLDLVITCESALAHIAGAIDKEVWIPYSFHAHDYRLGHDGEHMLWYTKHRLFKQDRDHRWQSCFDRMIEALREEVDAKSKHPEQAKRKRV
jgi:tetratricopeptide (TPR) repeat protein